MKNSGKLLNLLLAGLLIFGFMACNRAGDDDDPIIIPGDSKLISENITGNVTWTANNQYVLSGWIYVQPGAVLTIEPGTIIKGDKQTKGALFVKPGGKIFAVGTADKPIIFTSSQPAGQRGAGDWGGLVLCGKAPVNKTPAKVEGEDLTEYGGNDPADNSGELKYVRIEFAGIAYGTNQEINSLTMAGVGSGTKIEYIQVSYAGDDSFEWFGGTVNAKRLVAYRGLDDDFDTDNGYSGKVQYGFILRDPAIADEAGDSNGFESDNDGDGTQATPQTSGQFANVTVAMAPTAGTVNPKFASAMRIRRNSSISVYNSVFTGAWPRSGLRIHDALTIANFKAGKIKMDGVYLAGFGATTQGPLEGITAAEFQPTGSKNSIVAALLDLKFDPSFNKLNSKPNAIPQAGSPLLTGGTTLPAGFEPTTYVGAFGTVDWTDKWTNWDPMNADYTLKK